MSAASVQAREREERAKYANSDHSFALSVAAVLTKGADCWAASSDIPRRGRGRTMILTGRIPRRKAKVKVAGAAIRHRPRSRSPRRRRRSTGRRDRIRSQSRSPRRNPRQNNNRRNRSHRRRHPRQSQSRSGRDARKRKPAVPGTGVLSRRARRRLRGPRLLRLDSGLLLVYGCPAINSPQRYVHMAWPCLCTQTTGLRGTGRGKSSICVLCSSQGRWLSGIIE